MNTWVDEVEKVEIREREGVTHSVNS
jgi:hypothetical protein